MSKPIEIKPLPLTDVEKQVAEFGAVRREIDEQIYGAIMGGRRQGKSVAAAARAAAVLKTGGRVAVFTKGRLEEVVGVPGFDDGRQITDQSTPSCDDNSR